MLCEEGGKGPVSHLLPLLPHRHRAGASRHLAGWRPETPAVPTSPPLRYGSVGLHTAAVGRVRMCRKTFAKSRVTTADCVTRVRQHGA